MPRIKLTLSLPLKLTTGWKGTAGLCGLGLRFMGLRFRAFGLGLKVWGLTFKV